jgi:hypothetical protein
MSMQDWDYVTGDHPPDCSCEECTGEGLSGMEEETADGYTPMSRDLEEALPREQLIAGLAGEPPAVDPIFQTGQKPHR